MEDRVCPICGKTFTPKSSRRKMCYDVHYHNCPVCGKQVVTTDFQHLYSCCSKKCSRKLAMKSMHEKYEEWPCNSKEAKAKRAKTNIERYGEGCVFKSEKIKSKIRETNLEKYGVENPSQSREILQKTTDTCLKRYGGKRPVASSKIQAKIRQTIKDRYGVDEKCTLQVPEVEEKCLQSLQARYGVNNPMKSEACKRNFEKTCQEVYGATSYIGSKAGAEARESKLLDDYRVKYALQNDELLNKQHNTMIARYGVVNSFQLESTREKLRDYQANPKRVRESAIKRAEHRSRIVADDGTHFDSSYELIVYNFCKKYGFDVKCQIPIKYEYKGKSHTTLIDFMIDGQLVECKGYHLLQGIYDYAPGMVPIDVKLNVYKENNVVVVSSNEAKNLLNEKQIPFVDVSLLTL